MGVTRFDVEGCRIRIRLHGRQKQKTSIPGNLVASISRVPIPCIRTSRAMGRVTRRAHPSEPSPSPSPLGAGKGFLIISEHARVSRGSQFLHPIVRSSKKLKLVYYESVGEILVLEC